ncbi:hypothetical protein [Kineobactrum salinum]|uniref:Porin n=1 Tax=Kineobactrum salinum TaxID=2708301 RepID=A0A6C0U1Y6_9GAMM|nr:hypothetical protein [Kineobactrum salinum]QIB65928.1 hypothetical protein G3T16_11355 [Kineobactrum salinum]
MKRTLIFSSIAATLLAVHQGASADNLMQDVTWVPQIGVQWKTLEFEQGLVNDSLGFSDSGDFDADLPTLTLAFTAIYGKGYVSFKYEDSINDISTNSDVPFTDADTSVDRTDYSVTLGYNVWKGANVFVGYMEGETTLEPGPRCPTDVTQAAVCDGSAGGLSLGGNLAQDHLLLGLSPYRQNYEEDGWFLGASYAWKIADKGTLSVSLAYADLEAKYVDNYLLGVEGANENFIFDGDSDGLSYGVSWSAPLTSRVGYYLDIRRQSYDMRVNESSGNFPGLVVDTDETMTAFSAGLQFYL